MYSPDYLIVGVGAIGSILASHLAKAGHSVCVFARGERARDISERGIRIRGLSHFDVPVAVCTNAQDITSARVLIVATKTPGTATLLESIAHIEVGATYSIQNGLMKNALLGSTYGSDKLIGALANTSGELLASGEVNFTRNVNVLLGEPGGKFSQRVEELAHDLNHAGVNACAVENIESLEWSKFVNWVPLMLLSITTKSETWKFLSNAHSASLIVKLVKEVASLLEAQSLTLIDDGSLLPLHSILQHNEDIAIQSILASGKHFHEHAPQHKMSSLQDLLAGRSLELHETLGYALQRSHELNIDVPLLEHFFKLALAIDELN